MTFLARLIFVVAYAYLLAGIPILFLMVAGWASPMYRVDRARLAQWWSWMALIMVASAVLVYNVLPTLSGSGQ